MLAISKTTFPDKKANSSVAKRPFEERAQSFASVRLKKVCYFHSSARLRRSLSRVPRPRVRRAEQCLSLEAQTKCFFPSSLKSSSAAPHRGETTKLSRGIADPNGDGAGAAGGGAAPSESGDVYVLSWMPKIYVLCSRSQKYKLTLS